MCLLNYSSRNHCILINQILMPLERMKDGKGMNIFQEWGLKTFLSLMFGSVPYEIIHIA